MRVRVKRCGHHSLPLPARGSDGASGFDLRSTVEAWVRPGEVVSIPTGFAFEIPLGYELQVRPRSGLSKDGILVELGTVDSDYRGEVHVLATAVGRARFFSVGDRIAQAVIAPVGVVDLEETDNLSSTSRGSGGFGSTGVK